MIWMFAFRVFFLGGVEGVEKSYTQQLLPPPQALYPLCYQSDQMFAFNVLTWQNKNYAILFQSLKNYFSWSRKIKILE